MLLLAELCSWSRNVCLYMCMHVYSFECFKAKFFIDKALELIDKYNVILFYIIFFFGGGGDRVDIQQKKMMQFCSRHQDHFRFTFVCVCYQKQRINWIYIHVYCDFFKIKDVQYRIHIILKFDAPEYMNECLHVDKVYTVTLLVLMNLVHKFNS